MYGNLIKVGRNALLCACVWGVLIFVLGAVVTGGLGLDLIIGVILSFFIALGCFSLLEYLEGNPWWWPAMVGGMVVLALI